MMNPSLDPLLALLGQSERERDQALAELQQAQALQQAAQLQTEQLVAYRSEYEARFRDQFSRKSSIDILHCYQGFSTRLGQAIEQQLHVAANAAQRVERARSLLCDKELRVASVRKLLERRVHELRQLAGRNDQKFNDELAARAAWGPLRALRSEAA